MSIKPEWCIFSLKTFFFVHFYIFAAEECHEVAELIFNSNNNTNNAPKSATTGPLDFWRRKHKKNGCQSWHVRLKDFIHLKRKALNSTWDHYILFIIKNKHRLF